MKLLAMYLPQFHRVKENDEWWGEGYTEWTAVKNAKSLFVGHEQPKIPLDKKYYDLLNRKTLIYQAKLMNQYGIDGMCFYHYYFKDGKQILEKPAENLLQWTEINMPFCFCWANESWVRTWSNVKAGNVWSRIYEKDSFEENEKGILLEQKYGNEQDWKKHFYYLLPFFMDKRYIKKNGCPIFVIYKPESIPCLMDMKSYWNELAEKEGIGSIYFIEANTTVTEEYDNSMLYEPAYTENISFKKSEKNDYGIKKWISYDKFWQQLLLNTYKVKRGVSLGGVVGYDNTPRHGYSGMILYGATPEKFRQYFSALLIRAAQINSEFVFLNAWNEWAEGMYLEPDMKWKYAYLEAVLEAKKNYFNYMKYMGDLEKTKTIDNLQIEKIEEDDEIVRLRKENLRYRGYWMILNRWLELNLEGKSLGEYVRNQGYKKIAIYGLGMLGELLLTEFSNQGIRILYGIDQKGSYLKRGFSVYRLSDELPEVDLIIVTVNYEYKTIRKQLEQKIKTKVISLDALLCEM